MAKKNLKSKWCIVEDCKNTSVSTPNKIFIIVPKLRRNAWLEAAGRDPQTLSIRSTLYCCEDHFDLPNDVENWLEYSMMKRQMRFKENAVPHIFPSQPYWKRAASETDFRDLKRVRTVLPVLTDHELKDKSNSIVQSAKPILVDKCIQVTPNYQNKSVQCEYKEIKMEEASTSHCGIEFIDVNSIIDNNDKLLYNSTQTDDDKSKVPIIDKLLQLDNSTQTNDDKSIVPLIDSVNIKTECDLDNFEHYNYAADECTEEIVIKTEIDIKEEMLD